MSPLEIWCNEAQERYVLVIAAASMLERFAALCERERCPYAVVGETTDDGWLKVGDRLLEARAGRSAARCDSRQAAEDDARRAARAAARAMTSTPRSVDVREAAYRLLRFPAIADKTFLITIGDRTVGGMISRDPMVGPWQVPVSDVAVTVERLHVARPARRCRWASARRSRCSMRRLPGAWPSREAITNIAAADIAALVDVRLSANWMAACGEPGEDADLYATVQGGRRRVLSGARHHDSGRQGFAVDEDELAASDGAYARWSRRCR